MDPIGFDGGTGNLYEYARNRPTSGSDPKGTFSCWLCVGAALFNPLFADLCLLFCDGPLRSKPWCAPSGWGPALPPNVTPRPKDIPFSTCYTFCVTFLCVGPLSDELAILCDPGCTKICNAQTRVHSIKEICRTKHRDDPNACVACCDDALRDTSGAAESICGGGCWT